MTFSELVRLLEQQGFRLIREKGSARYYEKPRHPRLIRVDYHGSREIPSGTCSAILQARGDQNEAEESTMIDLKYSLVIEATEDPTFFGFHSPDLEGFTGVGHSVEDCIYQAGWGMEEHVALLRERGLPVPSSNTNPKVLIQNEPRLEAVG